MAGRMPSTTEERIQAARRAGWDPASGVSPLLHALPPDIDPDLGHNGIARPRGRRANLVVANLTDMVQAVLDAHWANVGFAEGYDNDNPWGPRQGIPHAPYCDSGQCVVAYDCGYRWQPECTYGELGCGYTVTHVQIGESYGEVRFDHTSSGNPADVEPADLLFYAWTPGQSYPDHVEGAVDYRSGSGPTHNIGYNTGSPEGCHEVWRDHQYLLCRLRPMGYAVGPAPTPLPAPVPDPDPLRLQGATMLQLQAVA